MVLLWNALRFGEDFVSELLTLRFLDHEAFSVRGGTSTLLWNQHEIDIRFHGVFDCRGMYSEHRRVGGPVHKGLFYDRNGLLIHK